MENDEWLSSKKSSFFQLCCFLLRVFSLSLSFSIYLFYFCASKRIILFILPLILPYHHVSNLTSCTKFILSPNFLLGFAIFFISLSLSLTLSSSLWLSRSHTYHTYSHIHTNTVCSSYSLGSGVS